MKGAFFMSTGAAMDSLVTSLTTGFSGIADDALSAIGSIVPYALPILGAGIVIALAIRTFKKAGK